MEGLIKIKNKIEVEVQQLRQTVENQKKSAIENQTKIRQLN